MLTGAFFLFTSTQDFLKSAVTTDGVVVELIRSRSDDSIVYYPAVEFRTQSGTTIEFTGSTGSNPPSYFQGEAVTVLYQESSPNHAKIKGFFSVWGVTTIVGGLGALFFLIGFSVILKKRSKTKKKEYLTKNGIAVKARIQEVIINRSLKVNNRSPYQIYAQWNDPATSEEHIFKSENIWFDPTKHINGDEITVLIERNNPKKYYMDISFLSK